MGFGGAVSSMITSLKNNKRTRPSAFNKIKSIPKGKYRSTISDKKATPYQLKQIREKLKEENKNRLLKKVLVICLILIVVIYFLGFHKF